MFRLLCYIQRKYLRVFFVQSIVIIFNSGLSDDLLLKMLHLILSNDIFTVGIREYTVKNVTPNIL